jgi:hypothetical protein
MRACQLKNEIYEPKKLEAVYQNIVARSKTDNPQYYEIRVDDFPVVEKTKDPERFMTYAEFVDANTKHISIFLYYSAKNASDKLFFHLQPNQFTHPNATGLNGFQTGESPLEQEKNQKEKWRKDLHYEQLLEENEELKQEIEELEKTIELIEEEKVNIKANRDLGATSIVSFLFDGVAGSKLVKDNFPFLNNLSGTNTNPTPETTTETENSYKRKTTTKEEPEEVEPEEVEGIVLSDDDKKLLGIMQEIKQRVGQIELANVVHLIDMVTLNPQAIHFAIKQVSNYLKQKPSSKTTEENSSNEQETNF